MKRLIITAILLAIVTVARSADFSEASPTGQLLYYTITSDNTVKVVSGATKPTGRLTIPSTAQGYAVTEIGSMAFNGCTNLTSVSVPGSVAAIGMRAFAGCSALTSAFLAEGVQTISPMAFSSCTSLDTISLPSTLTLISAGCFGNTSAINSLEHWQDSVLYISNYLVASMSARTGTLVVADGTWGIANIALDNCHINKCVLPQGLHFIGEQAFMSCTLLDTVQMLDSIPPTLAANAFQGANSNLTILVPCGRGAAYSATPNWSALNIVEDTCPPDPPAPPEPPVSLQTACPQQITATVIGNILSIEGAEGLPLAVTDVAGRRIHSTSCAQYNTRIALPAKGLYIVSVGTLSPLKVCYLK